MELRQAAEQVSDLIAKEAAQSNMLPQTADAVYNCLVDKTGFFIGEDLVLSYASLKAWSCCTELTSIITRPEYRGRHLATGVATRAVLAAQEANGLPIVVLSNKVSTNLCRRLGFREADRQTAFSELWEDCETCMEYGNFPNCHCHFMVLSGKLYHQNKLHYSIIDLAKSSDRHQTATLYTQVWQAPPWNEFDWECQDVFEYLGGIRKEPGGVALVATSCKTVIGFSAGWGVKPTQINQKTGNEQFARDYLGGQTAFYVAELGCDASVRRQRVGYHLTVDLLEKAEAQGYRRFVLRTHREAQPARELYKKFGFRETPFADPTFIDRTYWVR